jgi:hypothetical protein
VIGIAAFIAASDLLHGVSPVGCEVNRDNMLNITDKKAQYSDPNYQEN